MSQHPLTETLVRRESGVAIALLSALLLSFLIFYYGGLSLCSAAAAGMTFGLIQAASGYMYWYINSYISSIPGKVVMAILVLLVSLTGAFVALLLCGIEQPKHFLVQVPLMVIYGIFCWVVLLMWYGQIVGKSQMTEVEQELKEAVAPSPEEDLISRISVKEGSQIHIVHVEELHYIQAYGDYVILITAKGKYIKEQTMKYFELHLPSTFVRIHRSCIVNSEVIARVELFGKQSYNVYLKDGNTLKASTTGYKFLKEKLSL